MANFQHSSGCPLMSLCVRICPCLSGQKGNVPVLLQLSSLCQSSLKPQDKEGKKDLGSLTGCTAEDKTTIKASQDKLAASIEESLAMFPSNGAWVTPCLAHVLPVYNTEKQRKVRLQRIIKWRACSTTRLSKSC